MHIKEVTDNFSLDRIVPFFQPIMDISHETVWRFECLARLVTPDEQTFVPSEFLHIIEQQACISQLTETILNRSANYFRDLNAAWNININEQDMLNPDLIQTLAEALHDYPNPKRIGLELTAAVVLENVDSFETFAAQCRDLNIAIYIDHFGATPSNINSILSLPVNGIKIAGGLISQLMENQQTYEFVEHFTNLAKQKEISVVAVHVEDWATLEKLKELGIQYAQGYYFSMPKPNL
ncbi:EAL domain-containing protein [Aliiglaciecola sp. 3_MG-2023]|uniref:EAL domain-containing protein n=1 Tax=Aliiglaciecola sp. 3_MG-2023 TaxID=3062644 RepID=UPI0026E204B3|nr:EAL domain-containing protein [Aliiglaciecola sp. 3_MG-2023]MDO6692384.1 EAL domain-containing protein [Aliiglaciecola sp. 3_MG-2023]